MVDKLEISLDKLPIKRLDAIEENGIERFPPDVGYDDKRLSLIRRIDFAWAVDTDENRKKKKHKTEVSSATQWPWQSLVENLQLAHQELSIIVDLINTVEANDAITVASMTRPKQLPNEVLSDLAVSAATKMQCYRHLGKYFKQSAKALEQQIGREARFYGALIRLQQNWKVKRQRLAATGPGSEGFTFDLLDNLSNDQAAAFRPSMSTVRVDHDSVGMLALNLPPKYCRTLHFGFSGSYSDMKDSHSVVDPSGETQKGSSINDDLIKKAHSTLRKVHQSIFYEQVFDLVNHEAFKPFRGINVTGIQENYLQLSIGPGVLVFISLVPCEQGDQTNGDANINSPKAGDLPTNAFGGINLSRGDRTNSILFPDRVSFEIYLQQIFHEHASVNTKDRSLSSGKMLVHGQSAKDRPSLLDHFSMSLAHRIFSNKVLGLLENVVSRVPYLRLLSNPTWHSRISSWTVFMKVPPSTLQAEHQSQPSDFHHRKNVADIQFRTKVVINDDCISIEGEGPPNVIGLFKQTSDAVSSMNKSKCDLEDLPGLLLQQVAGQVIWWLHREALMVGIKTTQRFLCLSFELEQGETLSLVAHIDPDEVKGCISWWLVMEDGIEGRSRFSADGSDGSASECRKFLGHLSLEVLYSSLMDLVSLCNAAGNS